VKEEEKEEDLAQRSLRTRRGKKMKEEETSFEGD
jgi:hypothetical protein